jgi:lysylphosphatidylglycerol synthetase-like protein (DUF2156 family)
MDSTPPSPSPPSGPPPRAFTQGVGTVFQFLGVTLFFASMFVCCGSSLFSKTSAERHDLMTIGWNLPLPGGPWFYSAQLAITVSVLLAVFFGIALAGLGLGLQAQGRLAPFGAVAVCAFATAFWLLQAIFFGRELGSIALAAGAGALTICFGLLTGLATVALAEMRRNPPPPGHEILPPDFKVPYSHLHEDPPEVRLARELDQRREKLVVQQKELEMLEARLRRKLEQRPAEPDSPPPPATGDAP